MTSKREGAQPDLAVALTVLRGLREFAASLEKSARAEQARAESRAVAGAVTEGLSGESRAAARAAVFRADELAGIVRGLDAVMSAPLGELSRLSPDGGSLRVWGWFSDAFFAAPLRDKKES